MSWAKMRWAIFLSTAILLSGAGLSFAQPPGLVVDPLHRTMKLEGGDAIIDWREGYIQVTAIGVADPALVVNRSHERILATKTARLRAYEKLGEILNGVTVDSQGILGEELLRSSTLASSMTATIRNAQIIEEHLRLIPRMAPSWDSSP